MNKNVNELVNRVEGLKTAKGALARIEKFLDSHELTYFVMTNSKGKYVPVVVINRHTEWLAGHLAFSGIMVVNLEGGLRPSSIPHPTHIHRRVVMEDAVNGYVTQSLKDIQSHAERRAVEYSTSSTVVIADFAIGYCRGFFESWLMTQPLEVRQSFIERVNHRIER